MGRVGLWEVSETAGVVRLAESAIDLEQHLESWIAADPGMLQAGLEIIGRQVPLDAGRLDLLALDPQGRLCAVEIKRGAVRRETIAQVLDYAACLAELTAPELRAKVEPYLASQGRELDGLLEQRGTPDVLDPEERQVVLFLVGTGRAPGLERVVRFLAGKHDVPISLVAFDTFALPDGRRLLAREVTELDASAPAGGAREPKVTADAVLALAARLGTREKLERALAVASELGLRVRPYKTSLMFTPPANRNRMLFTLWAKPERAGLKAFVGVEAFTEFYPLERAAVEARLGREGWRTFSDRQFEEFLAGLQALDLKG